MAGAPKEVKLLRRMSLAAAGLLIALGAAQPAKADYAVLRSGQRLHITGWQTLGDTIRLDLPGGSVTGLGAGPSPGRGSG